MASCCWAIACDVSFSLRQAAPSGKKAALRRARGVGPFLLEFLLETNHHVAHEVNIHAACVSRGYHPTVRIEARVAPARGGHARLRTFRVGLLLGPWRAASSQCSVAFGPFISTLSVSPVVGRQRAASRFWAVHLLPFPCGGPFTASLSSPVIKVRMV